jgi:hypothetical protein
MEYYCYNLLEILNLLTLHNMCRHFDALFLINVFNGNKHCPSVLEAISIFILAWSIRNFNMFACSSSHCPSARCVSIANLVCKHTDFLGSLISVLKPKLIHF